MAATPYRPVAVNDKSLTKEKLQQMVNNEQWLFENSPRMRYTMHDGGLTRDNGAKILAGKALFGASTKDWVERTIYFGNFFSAACKPIVQVTIETTGTHLRKLATARSIDGGEIDHRGFICHISAQERNAKVIETWGLIHYTAIGF